jgi:hypothetical protein
MSGLPEFIIELITKFLLNIGLKHFRHNANNQGPHGQVQDAKREGSV